MKNPRLTASLLARASVLTLTIGLGSTVFAGPGPQYLQQMERIRARNTAQRVSSPVAVPRAGDAQVMTCPHCRTRLLQEPAFYNVSGKIAPRSVMIGKSHSCERCSGSITHLAEKVTDEMKRVCPVCAEAAPSCCSA